MRLQDIYIYPIKSLGGIRLTEAQVETRGLSNDRRWMLVDENGLFLTQRKHHQMALLQVQMMPDGLRVFHKQQREREHAIPFEPETTNITQVMIWDDMVSGQVVSESCNQWFSDILGFPCQLVYMPNSSERPIDRKYAVNQETVSFADAMPYMVIGQKSLDELNGRLAEPLPMDRFRPNFVFSGGEAFVEDHWGQVKIGTSIFKVTKPCARCVLTTVDQATGLKGKEPLKTLASYRTVNKKVLFGQNMIALSPGRIKVGDEINVL